MSLDLSTAGGDHLARECVDCRRRTDVPADVQSALWIQPPTILWWWPECPSHIPPAAPDEDMVVV